MREIKFRAWSKEMNYMSPVGQLNEMKSVLIYVPEQMNEDGDIEWDGNIVPIENIQLMQYTGLKDKNGVEIWEGDIISHSMGGDLQDNPSEVCWNEDGGWSPWFEYNNDNYYRVSNVEVIGNIYQNKELLK